MKLYAHANGDVIEMELDADRDAVGAQVGPRRHLVILDDQKTSIRTAFLDNRRIEFGWSRVDDDYVVETFQRVSQLQPDIVVMTGDFLSYHPRVFEQLPNVYRHFPRGRAATLAVLGNHDYGPNWAHPEIAQQAVETLKPFGITVLRNEIHEVDGLQVAGLDDWWARQFDAQSVLPRIDSAGAAVVLSHNPDTLDLPVWANYEGWILSGHTHGGQCKPPFLPPPLLPVQNRRYTAGEFALSGNRRLYINRGVGNLLHVRFNVRPEVTMFELASE